MLTRAASRQLFALVALFFMACLPETSRDSESTDNVRPCILLVTLDTTRADSLAFESETIETPTLDALAARGVRFSQAFTTAPMTLPAHASMHTGLYPSGHGIRENSRILAEDQVVLADRLRNVGYSTAAFISGYPLTRRFGLSRGFDHYDDHLGEGRAERSAGETTERVLAYLERNVVEPGEPLFLWVHYFDAHEPYAPPEPFSSTYPASPYDGEIAYVDRELSRLIERFEIRAEGSETRIIVVGDHGEGLGDHGEALHGNLLYQGVMRVPLILAGNGISHAVAELPVSTRRIYHTILAWAGLESDYDLLTASPEIVMAEALKPFLQYGWQPQVMAVSGSMKIIRSGDTEIYDLAADPSESENLSGRMEVDRDILEAIRGYPVLPATNPNPALAALDQAAKEQLASLGYFGSEGSAGVREKAPNPKDMAFLFGDLDQGSALFVREDYEAAIQVFEKVRAVDSENLMVTVRLAVAHSVLGHEERALQLFAEAEALQPESIDRQHYLAMHYFRFRHWESAARLFERVLAATPRRLPALEALARIREQEGRLEDATLLLERIIVLEDSPSAEWKRLGELEMALGDTPAAIRAFEEVWALEGETFDRFLELGVCYLADHRTSEAASALDRVAQDHSGYAMALFKRAQASVLLGERDWQERAHLAYERADPTIRDLIRREPLFQGLILPQ